MVIKYVGGPLDIPAATADTHAVRRIYVDTADAALGGRITTLEGTALTNQGTWVNTKTYKANDVVQYNGSSYVATSATATTDVPGTSAKWTVLAVKGTDGTSPAQPAFTATANPLASTASPTAAITPNPSYPNFLLTVGIPRAPVWNFRTGSSTSIPGSTSGVAALAANDYLLATGDNVWTVNLPATPAAGSTIAVRIVASSGFVVTVAPASGSSDTIDGLSDFRMLMLGSETEFVYDGAGVWRSSNHNRLRINFRGNYGASTTYLPGDLVYYLSYGPYLCTTSASSIVNTPPTLGVSTSTWQQMVPVGSPIMIGPYNINTSTGTSTVGQQSFTHGLGWTPSQAFVSADLANTGVFIAAYSVNTGGFWTNTQGTIRTYAASSGALTGTSLSRVNVLVVP